MLLYGEEMIGIVDWAKSASFKNVAGSSVFKYRIAYVELKIQVCPKVVNNYCPYPKVLTKPY